MNKSRKTPLASSGAPATLTRSAIALVLGLATSMPGFADDTEIYVGRGGISTGIASNNPNVLIVIDTSGSMSDQVITQTNYDPTVAYSDCFDPSRVYYSSASMPTACGNNPSFPRSMLRCDAAW